MNETALTDAERLMLDELQALEREMDAHYCWVYDEIAPLLVGSLLEVGSGAGVLSKFLVERGEPVLLTDYHEAYLVELRQRFAAASNVRVRRLNLLDATYDVGGCRVDTVLCMNVLEHIADDRHVLKQFAELLPAGGRLLLQVPHYPALYGSLDEVYGHFRRYSRRDLTRLLDAQGFEIRMLRNFNALGIPGWIWSAKLARTRRIDPRAMRLFNRLVPVARRIDRLLPFVGLGLLALAVRC